MNKNIMDYETVALDEDGKGILIIDQTLLPGRTQIIRLETAKEIWEAIYLLKVRGAPAIGVTAAFGLSVLARQIAEEVGAENGKAIEAEMKKGSEIEGQKGEEVAFAAFYEKFKEQKDYLDSARPTAVNLSWALNRMDRVCRQAREEGKTVSEIVEVLGREAAEIKEEDIRVCRSIGEYGLSLVKPGDGILTHCNAGQLATCKYGTATAPVYLGHERGYNFRLYVDETRPLLQGARLTAFELYSAGIDVTLLCDNMSASLMQKGLVQAVLVGCDRVAANGDTANKIGTSVVAAVAKQYHVPFYVCAPTSTIDFNTPSGDGIVIEQRDREEVSHMWYRRPMTADGVKIYNPAFDVTDHTLISGFITEKGIVSTPAELERI